MISIWNGGGLGYAATTDLSEAGLRAAVERARYWATVTAGAMVTIAPPTGHATGTYVSPVEVTWDTLPLEDRLELLHQQSRLLGIDERIVNWGASLVRRDVDQLLLTTSKSGDTGRIEQRFRFVYPSLRATANEGTNTQTRTFGGHAFCGQGGAEVLGRYGFGDAASTVAAQVLELLTAPNCPTGVMDALLAPDQMVLQIHESIGHPLELDRILGDERNYAGTSFVTPEMFGTYQYGSELLNVTFDPTVPGQLASYGFDDDGTPAERHHLIENGILVRGLGGAVSQERSGLPGVANSRAQTWNRPPIDRMANLNVEPGESTVDELIASIEHGVYLHTNNSWSIDDSRNKFQFGCEYGQRIEQRRDRRRRPQPGLPRHLVDLLAQPLGRRRPRQLHRDGHTRLRQGRAQPDDRHRTRVARLQVLEHRGVRRRDVSSAADTTGRRPGVLRRSRHRCHRLARRRRGAARQRVR